MKKTRKNKWEQVNIIKNKKEENNDHILDVENINTEYQEIESSPVITEEIINLINQKSDISQTEDKSIDIQEQEKQQPGE